MSRLNSTDPVRPASRVAGDNPGRGPAGAQRKESEAPVARKALWISNVHAFAFAIGMSLSFAACAELNGSGALDESDAMDTPMVRQSVISTVKVLNEVYVYPETARSVGVEMIKRLESGVYDRISTKQAFADRIGSELAELSKDGHLGVLVAEGEEPPTHVLKETVDRFKLNYAFQKVEILDGNIGYLKFNKFHQDEEAQAIADHAFGFLGGADALIIDLTECKGGSPDLVSHMLSYFFSDKTLLWSIYDRKGVSVYDAYSSSVGTARFKSDFPVFILTGPDTASAAELFAYTLKTYGKAKTVGQGTDGIAHLVGALPINEHFVGRFSTYRNVNPVTKSNWEGVGIAPDTNAAPEDSLNVAIRMATASIERK